MAAGAVPFSFDSTSLHGSFHHIEGLSTWHIQREYGKNEATTHVGLRCSYRRWLRVYTVSDKYLFKTHQKTTKIHTLCVYIYIQKQTRSLYMYIYILYYNVIYIYPLVHMYIQLHTYKNTLHHRLPLFRLRPVPQKSVFPHHHRSSRQSHGAADGWCSRSTCTCKLSDFDTVDGGSPKMCVFPFCFFLWYPGMFYS